MSKRLSDNDLLLLSLLAVILADFSVGLLFADEILEEKVVVQPSTDGSAALSESRHLRNIRQLTFYGPKNGEAYFSQDGREIIFQGVREKGNPFYQIYRMNRSTGESTRLSPGSGRTTCAFFHPKKHRVIFASTHLDPASESKQVKEIEIQKAGRPKRYSWDFDPFFDIFELDLNSSKLIRLTDSDGYDAEGSYSPDGKHIVFCSMRDHDGEIYVMDADGKNQKRLTFEPGYDGGPFFSPDKKQIVWRHFTDESQKTAEIWSMDVSGSNKRQITHLNSISWAPYFHPSMKWIVFASNVDDPGFDLYAIRPDGGGLTRLTFTHGFDGLPAISPDGGTLLWTSTRTGNKSQIFCADLSLEGESKTAEPSAEHFQKNMAMDGATWLKRASDLAEVGPKGGLEHRVAHEFRQAGLSPPVATKSVEDTFYIQGPSVSGWLSPNPITNNGLNKSPRNHFIVIASSLKPDMGASMGLAGLVEAARALRGEGDKRSAGLYVVAANADAMTRIHSDSEKALISIGGTRENRAEIAAFISFAGFENINSGQLLIRGAGTSTGWRQLTERLAARHPQVQIIIEDDHTDAPVLAQFIEKKIPCIELSGSTITSRDTEGMLQGHDLLIPEAPAFSAQRSVNVILAAIDAVRLLAREDFELAFKSYDAVAERAAASALLRPYLGTIPEYNSKDVNGVKLAGVREGSPAQQSGLKAGDVIIEIAEKPVNDVSAYLQVLETLKPGVNVVVRIQREGKTEALNITPVSR